jgi:adenylate cyclase
MNALSFSNLTGAGSHLTDMARRFGIRRLRLTAGLVLFAYVALHLTNHALGNISLGWMERGLIVQKWIWQSIPGTLALYTALLTHLSLGIWALYERRQYGWGIGDVVQVAFGLTIPLLLAHHLTVTRIDLALYGTEKGYAQELYSFWVASPMWGVVQVLLLIVVWIHGCLGLYYWLRLKRFFPRFASLLLAAAVLLPILALLGFVHGGQEVVGLSQGGAWRATNLTAAHVGTRAENAELEKIFAWIIGIFLVAVAATLVARGIRVLRERWHGFVRLHYPNGRTLRVPQGFSILEASLMGGIPHACICGGRARCSTCRIRVVGGGELPPPSEIELAVLRRVRAGSSVRLACQLRPINDMTVFPLLPVGITIADLQRRMLARGGEERFIVILIADMRGSTEFAHRHLAFDAVFAIGGFVEAIGRAVVDAGGHPNQFIGDGLLAMFGVDCPPAQACRRALNAAAQIGANVAKLNETMAAEWAEPVRFGIGIHGGEAIVGEIGYRDNTVFTALGDPVNVTSRLQDQCKELRCEVVVSDIVCEMSGLSFVELPVHALSLRGRADVVSARAVPRATDLADIVAIAAQPSL